MKGRCAGCGAEGSVRAMQRHVQECPDYLTLYRAGQATLPAEEYERYVLEDKDNEKAEKKQARMDAFFDKLDRGQAAQAERWATPEDPLA